MSRTGYKVPSIGRRSVQLKCCCWNPAKKKQKSGKRTEVKVPQLIFRRGYAQAHSPSVHYLQIKLANISMSREWSQGSYFLSNGMICLVSFRVSVKVSSVSLLLPAAARVGQRVSWWLVISRLTSLPTSLPYSKCISSCGLFVLLQ